MALNMLGALGVGWTMVGADQSATSIVDAGGGTSTGETRVSGSLSLLSGLSGSVSTGTSTTARLGTRATLTVAQVNGRTSVAADMTASTLHGGHVATGTTVTGETLTLAERWKPGQSSTIQGKTAPRGTLSLINLTISGKLVTGKTTVTADLVKPKFLSPSTIAATTQVSAVLDRHILRGAINTGTSVGAQMANKGKLFGQVTDKTGITATLRRLTALATSAAGVTTVRGRLHSYPTDFQDVRIITGTRLSGAIGISTSIQKATVSTITGKTTVISALVDRLRLAASPITGRTSVTAKLRFAFGNDIIGRTGVFGRLGIKTGLSDFNGKVKTRTTVTALPPENRFKGTSAGKTIVKAQITIAFAVTGNVLTGTSFHSHFPGRRAYDGPMGSVNLTAVPRGDLGVASEIGCSTTPTADITIERRRLLVMFGNAGLAVQRGLVAHGTVVAGTETRYVGERLDAPVPVAARSPYYV